MNNQNFAFINSKHLLGLYLICPILLVITVIDIFLLGSSILNSLPSHPNEWAFWLVIFSLPHIMSSFITIADKDNLSRYGFRISKAIVLLLIISITLNGLIPSNLSGDSLYQYQVLFFIVYGISTIYHVISQQLGISLILCRAPPSASYKAFKLISLALSFILFSLALLSSQLTFNNDTLNLIYYVCVALLILSLYFGYRFTLTSKTKTGTLYVYLNLFMLASLFIFIIYEYYVFFLIIPRFIHDITAFMFYANHDKNKYTHQGKNYIYRPLTKLPLPISIISPMLGIAIAYSINHSTAWIILYGILIFDFLHYYIESFIWKSGGTHREFLKIKLIS